MRGSRGYIGQYGNLGHDPGLRFLRSRKVTDLTNKSRIGSISSLENDRSWVSGGLELSYRLYSFIRKLAGVWDEEGMGACSDQIELGECSLLVGGVGLIDVAGAKDEGGAARLGEEGGFGPGVNGMAGAMAAPSALWRAVLAWVVVALPGMAIHDPTQRRKPT